MCGEINIRHISDVPCRKKKLNRMKIQPLYENILEVYLNVICIKILESPWRHHSVVKVWKMMLTSYTPGHAYLCLYNSLFSCYPRPRQGICDLPTRPTSKRFVYSIKRKDTDQIQLKSFVSGQMSAKQPRANLFCWVMVRVWYGTHRLWLKVC